MAAYVFQRILDDAQRSGVKAGNKNARDWFRTVARNTRTTPERLMRGGEENDRVVRQLEMGSMYAFWYDPKHKKTLPYYDRFPLIFPVDDAPGGFYGINFHYLPYKHRAVLMDALYGLRTNKKVNNATRLNLSYRILKSSSKFSYYKPAFKHYLLSHMRSRFLQIFPKEWDIAVMLPIARFEKANIRTVWADSRRATK